MFAHPGIPGYIFLEGDPSDVTATTRGLVTVYKSRPRLVPTEHQTVLLSRRNPLSRCIHDGEWVCSQHGLYRDDTGIICGHVPSSDAEVIVAFIPQIEKTTGSAKRKRVSRPLP